ncbi:hypothetical protein RCL_jg25621.t1 [Rhizophagus clarus]|uniref:Uncharacterized protein n=1 Tax=Rhizophagus clarus TaxID=94130 RepID=A0A8H3LKH3_9GLOM|nr:hypothetical protein RCL_jg25621.t1 [Rhizophagus clarus]
MYKYFTILGDKRIETPSLQIYNALSSKFLEFEAEWNIVKMNRNVILKFLGCFPLYLSAPYKGCDMCHQENV